MSTNIGTEISRIIREASGKRNDTSAKINREVEKIVSNAQTDLEDGFNSSVDKEKVISNLTEGLQKLAGTKIRGDLLQKKRGVTETNRGYYRRG